MKSPLPSPLAKSPHKSSCEFALRNPLTKTPHETFGRSAKFPYVSYEFPLQSPLAKSPHEVSLRSPLTKSPRDLCWMPCSMSRRPPTKGRRTSQGQGFGHCDPLSTSAVAHRRPMPSEVPGLLKPLALLNPWPREIPGRVKPPPRELAS